MFKAGLFSLGGRSAAVAPDQQVLHIKQPQFPQFRFEWHPGKSRVYVIRIGSKPEVGEILAHDIADHGAATNVVLIWLRGFREGSIPKICGLTLADRQRVAQGK